MCGIAKITVPHMFFFVTFILGYAMINISKICNWQNPTI